MRKRLKKKLARQRIAERFNALALYVFGSLPDLDLKERWAKTMWILFRVDFTAYRDRGSSVTGVIWTKGRSHPEPRFP
jgi:hypothetical protein